MEPVSDRRSICLNGFNYSADSSYFITVCVQHKEHRFGYIADGVMWLNEAGQMVKERTQAIPARFPGTLIDSFVVMPNHIHFILTLLEYLPHGGHIPNDAHMPNGTHVGAAHRGRPLSDRQGRPDTPNTITGVEAQHISGIPDVSDRLTISGPIGPKAGGHDGPPLHGNDAGTGNVSDGNEGVVSDEHGSVNRVADNVPSLSDIIGWFKASTTNYYIRGVKAGTYPAFDRRLWQWNYYEHIIKTETVYNQIDECIRTNPQRWAEDRLR